MDLWNIPPQSWLNITSFIQLLQGVMLLKMAFHEALTLSPRLLMENGLYLVNLFSLYPLESVFDNKSKSAKTIIIFTIFILLTKDSNFKRQKSHARSLCSPQNYVYLQKNGQLYVNLAVSPSLDWENRVSFNSIHFLCIEDYFTIQNQQKITTRFYFSLKSFFSWWY